MRAAWMLAAALAWAPPAAAVVVTCPDGAVYAVDDLCKVPCAARCADGTCRMYPAQCPAERRTAPGPGPASAAAGETAWSTAFLAIVVGTAFLLYFVPTILAHGLGHPSSAAIVVVNLLFGWTVIGWIVALVWALTSADRRM